MMVLQTLLMLSVSLLLCSGVRLNRQSSDYDDGDDSKRISLPNTDICGLTDLLSPKISGGRPAKLKEFPWMAVLGYVTLQSKNIKWDCGGSLITNQHVLTAAHCVDESAQRDMTLTIVRLGELDLDETVQDGAQPQDLGVEDITVHEQWDHSIGVNDIAIIKMKAKVTFTDFIKPICLAPELFTKQSFEGHRPKVAGWGKNVVNKTETRDTHLMVVDVEIQSLENCRKNVTNDSYVHGVEAIDSRVICAFTKGQDACQGDSGGPLMKICQKPDNSVNYYLMGIVSYGPSCTNQDRFGVYTKVSSFMRWIDDNLH